MIGDVVNFSVSQTAPLMVRFDTYNASAHLVRQIENSGIASVIHDGADNLLVELDTGELVSIYLIETRIPAYELRMTLKDNGEDGIYSLFILWSDMFLHKEGQPFQPEEWLLALVNLYGGKVYAFDVFGKDIRIFPAFFERVEGAITDFHIRFAPDIDVTRLGCDTVEMQHIANIRGVWLIADFAHEQHTARRERQQRTPRTKVRSHWEVLGITPIQDREAIKRAYRRLARRYHPDLNAATDTTAQMQRLNQAYDAILRELDNSTSST